MYGVFRVREINNCCFFNLAKQRLKDHFLQNWFVELRMSTRALCYREISTSIDFKVFFNFVNIPKHRIALNR